MAFCWRLIFQSTFPLRGATRSGRQPVVPHRISIHVPLVGSDGKAGRRCTVSTYFNPRSPCGERQATRPTGTAHPQFQSTLPLRGATGRGRWHDFHRIISIHAPLAGNDSCATLSTCDCRFQSTLPLRGETFGYREHDRTLRFQSTLPLRGATRSGMLTLRGSVFQSTLPLRGTTCAHRSAPGYRGYFNPRSPCGERLILPAPTLIQSNFNPRSPCGERHGRRAGSSRVLLFQSTLPLRGATG